MFKTSPPELNGHHLRRAPLDVTFNMCPSDDPDHDLLLFTMDANLDGTLEVRGTTGVDCRRSFRYPAGKTRARVCVTDVDARPRESAPAPVQVYSIDGDALKNSLEASRHKSLTSGGKASKVGSRQEV